MVKAQALHVRFNSDSDRQPSKRDPALRAQEPTMQCCIFSQVIESPPGRAAAVPPHRILIQIKKSRNIFSAKGDCFPRG
jgi:hypothetical protein